MDEQKEQFEEQIETSAPHSRTKLYIEIVIVALMIVVAGGYFLFIQKDTDNPTACTLEAGICSDGSAIGRTGPNCEFAECPSTTRDENIDTSGWKTYRNEKYGFEFRYPADWKTFERSDMQSIGLLPADTELNADSYGDISILVNSSSTDEAKKLYSYYVPKPTITEYNSNAINIVIFRNIPRDVPGQSGYGEAYFTSGNLTVVVRKFWENEQGEEVFDGLIDSFKFTEPQTVTELKSSTTGLLAWNEQRISNANGSTLITTDSFPKSVHIFNELDSEEFDALPPKRILEVVVSPDGSRLAIVTSEYEATRYGNEMGWIYVIDSDTFSAVAYDEIVEIKGWGPDSNFVVFLEVDPFPFPFLTVVDVRALTGNPWTTGTYIHDLIPEDEEGQEREEQILWPKVFNYIGWIDGLLCVKSDVQYCLDLENNIVQKQE